MVLNQSDIINLDQNYRRAFINSLAGFRQAVLIGTKSESGQSNLSIFNSLIHLGANPALFGIVSRPETVQRDTIKNILDTKQYTLNYVSSDYFVEAHQTSARYETHISEFEAVGFTEKTIDPFIAPYVNEAIINIGMQFEEKIDIKINGTVLIIGSIQYIEVNDKLVSIDGFINLEAANILVSCGLDAYFKTQSLGRLSYAKPDKWPITI
jgi:flavin reductase (DIM6/NTAB) family NADH-FMN oxidoreductase RutF